MLNISFKFLTVKYPVLHTFLHSIQEHILPVSQGILLPGEPSNWPPHIRSSPFPTNPFSDCQLQTCPCPSPAQNSSVALQSFMIKFKLLFEVHHNWPSMYLSSLPLALTVSALPTVDQDLCKSCFLYWTTSLIASLHLAVC